MAWKLAPGSGPNCSAGTTCVRHSFRVCAGMIVVAAAIGAAPAAHAQPSEWLIERALEWQLRRPVPVIHWQEAPLRKAVATLARTHRVAVLFDRRIDPGQPLTLSAEDVPLVEVFRRVAESRGLAMGRVGPVLYYGPPEGGPQLETVLELRRQEIRKQPARIRQPLLKKKGIQWSDFAEPRALLGELVQEERIHISGLEEVPHDLWAEADLPPLALVDRLGLIIGQFNLTFELDLSGRGVTLIPFPDDVGIVETYPGGREPERTVRRWSQTVPGAQFKIVHGKMVVRGLLAEHRRIAQAMSPSRSHAPGWGESSPTETRFTVREAKGSLRHLLKELTDRLELKLRVDETSLDAAGVSLDQQVSLSVRDATVEGLLEALLKPAGCTFQLDGRTLLVRPAK